MRSDEQYLGVCILAQLLLPSLAFLGFHTDVGAYLCGPPKLLFRRGTYTISSQVVIVNSSLAT